MRRFAAGRAAASFRAAALTAAPTVALIAGACASDIAEPTGPRMEFTTDTVDFGIMYDVVTTDMRNPGGNPLQWQIHGAPAWLSVQPSSGTLEPGGTQTMEFAIVRDVTPLGLSLLDLVVESNVFTGPVGFAVRVDVPPTPALALVSVGAIEYPGGAAGIVIRNDGRGPLHYEASPDVDWAEVLSAVGTVNDGQSREVTVVVDRARVSRDTVVSITFVSNGLTEPMVVPVYVAGNPETQHVAAGITNAGFVGADLFYAAGGATYRLDYRSGTHIQLQGVAAMDEAVRDPGSGRFAIRHGSQVSVFEPGDDAPFNTVDVGEPLGGMTYLVSGMVAVIPASASEGRITSIDPISGAMTVHVTDLPPFRYVLPSPNNILVTTADGLYWIDPAADRLVDPDYGGTGLVFDGNDGKAWHAGYLFTSSGQYFVDHPPGLTILGQLRNQAGTEVDAIRSAVLSYHALYNQSVVVTGHVAGEGWRVRVGLLDPSDLYLTTIALPPVWWNGSGYDAEPRLATWQNNEIAVLEEVTTGPAAGQWFLSRSWYR